MSFTPKDQIILLAGLDPDHERRRRLWSLPALAGRLARLTDAGLVDSDGLTESKGIAAARRLHHISLDDLLAEHLSAETQA